VELCKNICLEAPQLKVPIVSAKGFLPALTGCVASGDGFLVMSSIGLLHELIDDQAVATILSSDAALKSAFEETRRELQTREGEDREAVEEELEMADVVAEVLGLD
jgi:hypothetical protein